MKYISYVLGLLAFEAQLISDLFSQISLVSNLFIQNNLLYLEIHWFKKFIFGKMSYFL